MYDTAFRAFDTADYDEALKALDAIDARQPGLAESLNLRGVIYMRQRKFEKAEGGKGYHRIERGYGSFARAFTLPETLDAEKVKADYNAGVLTVTLGKKEVAKSRTVKVEVNGK